MKNKLIVILILSPLLAAGQGWKSYFVDVSKKFSVERYGQIALSDFAEDPKDTLRADLMVNSDTMRDIRLATAKLRNDTLAIEIFRTDASYHHEYTIYVTKNKYSITYRFLISGDRWDEGQVRPIETKLVLSTDKFLKSDVVSGYTEFKGLHVDHEKTFKENISVKGNFKVTIK